MWRFQYFLLILLIYFINKAEGLKCYQCGELYQKSCYKELSELDLVECAADEDSCFTYLEEPLPPFKLNRGCKVKAAKCPGDCRECDQDGCNTHVYCYIFDSKFDKENNDIKVCPGGKDICMAQVRNDKFTEYKCVESSFKCDKNNAKTCYICNKTRSFCPFPPLPFPEDRLMCYQCSDNCEKLEYSRAKPCRLYDENEMCYSIGTTPTNMKRGCMSDINHKSFDKKHVTCNMNGCNDQRYIREPSRKCFQCGLDETCSKEAILCKKSIEYWKLTEECFTQTVSGKIIQGCVNDRGTNEKPCTAENSCKIYNTDGCNSIVVNKEDHSNQDLSGVGSGNRVYINYVLLYILCSFLLYTKP